MRYTCGGQERKKEIKGRKRKKEGEAKTFAGAGGKGVGAGAQGTHNLACRILVPREGTEPAPILAESPKS